LSQRIGGRLRDHLVYKPWNTIFSNIIIHVETKDEVSKANTEMVFTDKCMPMYTQLSG